MRIDERSRDFRKENSPNIQPSLTLEQRRVASGAPQLWQRLLPPLMLARLAAIISGVGVFFHGVFIQRTRKLQRLYYFWRLYSKNPEAPTSLLFLWRLYSSFALDYSKRIPHPNF